MWPGFRELQCVLAAPSVEKRLAPLLHDDSGRLVDMSMVRENLFIGDEYENNQTFFCFYYRHQTFSIVKLKNDIDLFSDLLERT